MSGKNRKHPKHNPSAVPDQHGGQQNLGSSDVNVRGEIEVGRASNLAKEHETERREDTAHERKKFIVEILTLAAVVVYAGVTIWQAWLTRTAITDARENFVKDQAPYIWVTPQPPVMKLDEPFRWDVHYSNYGRSPALNVRRCIVSTYGPSGFSYLDTLAPPSMNSQACRDAQGTRVASVSVAPPGFPGYSTALGTIPLKQSDIDAIAATEAGAILWGIVAYDDRSGHSYEAVFCSFRFKSGAISDCPKYNYINQTR